MDIKCLTCGSPTPRARPYCCRGCYRKAMAGVKMGNLCHHGYRRSQCHVCRRNRDKIYQPDRYICRDCGRWKHDPRSQTCHSCKKKTPKI